MILLAALFFLGAAVYIGLNIAEAATSNVTQVRCIGIACNERLELSYSSGVAVDPEGNMWVSDSSNNRVMKYDEQGNQLSYIGAEPDSYGYSSYGSGNGELYEPRGMVADSYGNVFVVDRSNYRVQKFDPNGNYISQFGSYGDGNGQFSYLDQGIATDSYGNVYVADTYNNRVQKFDPSGNYVSQFGSYGTGDGEFIQPSDLAIDSYGAVFVTDTYNNRVVKFSSSGTYQSQFGTSGSNPENLNSPSDIEINSAGTTLYVASDSTVKVFSTSGIYQSNVGSYGEGNGEYSDPTSFTLDADDNIYVTEEYPVVAIEKFNSSHQSVATFLPNKENFDRPIGVTLTDDGGLFVVDMEHSVVRKFNSYYEEESQIGHFNSYGSYAGELNGPGAVAVDSYGYIYVTDSNNDRVQKFDSYGDFVSEIGSSGSGNGEFADPMGIAVGPNNNVYVTDAENSRVQVFDSNGTFVSTFGSYGSGETQFQYPMGLEIDQENGDVYVADTLNSVVKKFSSNGTYLATIGTPGDGGGDGPGGSLTDDPGELYMPYGVALDDDGNLWVTDSANSRIQKFSSNGAYISHYTGTETSEATPLTMPVLIDYRDGTIAVSEMFSSSVVILQDDDVSSTTTTTTTTTTSSTSTTTTTTTTAPVGPDTDGDGTPDSTEDNGPNGGDGNADGTSDSAQGHVATVYSAGVNKYISIEAPDDVRVLTAEGISGVGLTTDSGYSYPGGFASFVLETDPGDTVDVTVTFHNVSSASDFIARKVSIDGSNATYSTITNATITPTTIGGQNVVNVTYSLTDGGDLDEDGVANGEIVDPVGVASATVPATNNGHLAGGAPITGSLPMTGSDTDFLAGFASLLLSMGLTLSTAKYRRRRTGLIQ